MYHHVRKAQYNASMDTPMVLYDRVGNTYVGSPTKKGDRKLREMIGRISKQTESSGRKNRGEVEVIEHPQSAYTTTYYNPHASSSGKKLRKK